MVTVRDLKDQVVLVDRHDAPIGTRDKLEVHRTGELHRAFSVFVFDAEDRLILQQRALDKYHSGGLWTNTCCSHPRPGETVGEAAERRLREEMGIHCQALEHQFTFIYRAEMGNGLVEHELDHVLFARYTGDVRPNDREAMAWRAVTDSELDQELRTLHDRFTAWLRICWPMVKERRGAVLRRAV
ncbi:MAG: isopentenyl-diphosphate Delta-isomerase [Flavobacteriales bacterium]|nr:isopentenyl-diphosphate Delta-isomerase [Flavobacteriales bacterium]